MPEFTKIQWGDGLDVTDQGQGVIRIDGSGGPAGATGPAGPTGPQGDPGLGFPPGGTAGQVLAKDTATDYDTSWQTIPEGPAGPPGPPGPSNASYTGTWNWTTKTTDANVNGQVGVNNASVAAATVFHLSQQTTDATDVTTIISQAVAGDEFDIQEKADATHWVRYLITGAGTAQGNWWSWPVTFEDGGGTAPLPNADVNVSLLVEGGAAGHTIADEGVALAARATLNFVGAGVTAADDSANDRTNVTISGGGLPAITTDGYVLTIVSGAAAWAAPTIEFEY